MGPVDPVLPDAPVLPEVPVTPEGPWRPVNPVTPEAFTIGSTHFRQTESFDSYDIFAIKFS